MVSYSRAAAALLATAALHSAECFQTSSSLASFSRRGPSVESSVPLSPSPSPSSRRREIACRRHISAVLDGDGNNGSGSGDESDENAAGDVSRAIVDVGKSYLDMLAAEGDDDDDDNDFGASAAARRARRRVVVDRAGEEGGGFDRFAYDVTLPMRTTMGRTVEGSLGLSIRAASPGGKLSERALDLDTLIYQSFVDEMRGSSFEGTGAGSVELLDGPKRETLDDNFKGLVVSSVVRGGLAWEAGVRVGDEMLATSATLGEKLWPKSTLDGVRSALSSRKLTSATVTMQLRRSGAHVAAPEVVEEFELQLTKPLGIEVEDDDESGYVLVTGFTDDAQPAVRDSVKKGDRVVAVDSSLGTQMWPVSNVEGLVSACTSRLPGQPVRLKFERVVEVGEWTANGDLAGAEGESVQPALAGAVDGYVKLDEETSTTSDGEKARRAGIQSVGSKTHKMLLSRCRDIMGQYMEQDNVKKSVDAQALVADRVLEALADASAPLDGKTLSMIMNAYLAGRRPEGAIRAFEAATGLAADGSATPTDVVIVGKKNEGSRLPSDAASLSLFSGTALLRAHALGGDYAAAARVLAAMEGRDGYVVSDVAATAWPRASSEDDSWVTDSRCYNVVLAAAARAGTADAVKMAIDLFDGMADPSDKDTAGRPAKTVVSYNTMIGVFAQAGRLQDAYTILYTMKQAGLKPDKFSYTALIKAAVASGNVNEGRDLLSEMESEGIEADAHSYNTIIKGLCARLRWFEAKELVTEMEWNGVSPDSLTYGLLMNGLLKANKPGPCLTLFESACSDPRTSSRVQNVQIYTTAVTAASMLGDHARALGLVARMMDAGVKPNLKTFTSLMGGCLSSGKTSYALEVFNKIDDPDGYSLTLGVKAHCDAGDYASACDILSEQKDGYHEMSGKQIMSSYNYVIQSSLQRFRYGIAREALSELLQSGYIPSKATFRAIQDGLDIIPKKEKVRKAPSKAELAEAKTKHDFLLFVLDMLEARKLPCSGSFYASILFEGSRIGGLRKKLSSLLSQARAESKKEGEELSSDAVECVGDNDVCLGWEDLVRNYADYRDKLGVEIPLPTLHVRIGEKEIRSVLSAERTVTYGGRKAGRSKALTGRGRKGSR